MEKTSWYGIPFTDLDCVHWLPYLTEDELGQDGRKLTVDFEEDFPRARSLSSERKAA